MDFQILAITIPLLAICACVIARRKSFGTDWAAFLGLASTLIGDWFLAINHASRDSIEFVFGVCGFALAHLFWNIHFARNARRPVFEVMAGLLVALLPYLATRVLPNAVPMVGISMVAYTVLSCLSVSLALGGGRILWCLGIGLLFVSDFCISAGSFTDEPHLGRYVAPLYVLSLVCIALAIVFPKPSFPLPFGSPHNRKCALRLSLVLGALGIAAFVWAMLSTPDGQYSPLRQMLSYLGRTQMAGHPYPACHYRFVLGMLMSALGIAVATPHIASLAPRDWCRKLVNVAGALNAGGLMMIALVPEDVDLTMHCAGCVVAGVGGAIMLLAVWPRRWEWALVGAIVLIDVAFEGSQALCRAGRIPFAPGVPTLQKALIVSFMLWCAWQILKALHELRTNKEIGETNRVAHRQIPTGNRI